MALVKIYSKPENKEFLKNDFLKSSIEVFSEALNCPEIPTSPSQIEIVYGEGIDLGQIDFIIEIIACKRPDLQERSQRIISSLNKTYPDKSFSIYFNLINENGMAHTPRKSDNAN